MNQHALKEADAFRKALGATSVVMSDKRSVAVTFRSL
jgi:hypothetical protein